MGVTQVLPEYAMGLKGMEMTSASYETSYELQRHWPYRLMNYRLLQVAHRYSPSNLLATYTSALRETILRILFSLLLLITATACSAEEVSIGDSFQGYWENIDSRYNNWWEIRNNRVINFGINAARDCESLEADITGDNKFTVDFGNQGNVVLKIEDEYLVFTIGNSVIKHKKVMKTDICKRFGKYFNQAPYSP